MKKLVFFGKWLGLTAGELAKGILIFPMVHIILIPILIESMIEQKIRIRSGHLTASEYVTMWGGYKEFFFDEYGPPIFDWIAILNPSEYFRDWYDRAEEIRIYKRQNLSPYRVWLDHRRPVLLKRYKERFGIK